MSTSVNRDDASIQWRIARPQRNRFLATTMLCLGMLAAVCFALLSLVLHRPERTPLLTLTASYGTDWDLNAWVHEDLQRVKCLGERTFELTQCPNFQRAASGLWDEADGAMRDVSQACPDQRAIAVYVNAHGAVNDQGQPCLIPPAGLPNDSDTWIPLETLLSHLVRVQDPEQTKPIMLILECGRIHSHWSAGITNNQFSDRLDDLVERFEQRHPTSQLAILSSTRRGERSFAVHHGGGSVFTRFVVDGLSGMADGFGSDGEADGLVDTAELGQYVRHHTLEWSEKYRGQTQTPRLLCSGQTSKFSICTAGRSKTVPNEQLPEPSPKQLESLTAATLRVKHLREQKAGVKNAFEWSMILRTHHGLRQSIYGGYAVRKQTKRLQSTLDRQLAVLEKQIAVDKQSGLGSGQLDSAAAIWNAVARAPDHDDAKQIAAISRSLDTTTAPMLHAWVQQPSLSLWDRPQTLRRIAKAQSQWCVLTDQLPDQLVPAMNLAFEEVHRSRRDLADTILLMMNTNRSHAMDEAVDGVVETFCKRVERSCESLQQLKQACETRDLALSEIPLLMAWKNADVQGNNIAAPQEFNALLALDDKLSQLAADHRIWDDRHFEELKTLEKRSDDYVRELHKEHSLVMNTDVKDAEPSKVSRAAGRVANAIDHSAINLDPRLHAANTKFLRRWDLGPGSPNDTNSGEETTMAQGEHEHYLAWLLRINPAEFSESGTRERLRHLMSTLANENGMPTSDWRRVIALSSGESVTRVISAARSLALRNRLASEATVVLGDFWQGPMRDGTAYFQYVAEDLLSKADTLSPEQSDWKHKRIQVSAKIKSRTQASKNAVGAAATSEDNLGNTRGRVVFALNEAQQAGKFPAGIAAMSIGLQRVALPIGKPASSSTLANSTAELILADSSSSPEFATMEFRGHEYKVPIHSGSRSFSVESPESDAKLSTKITFTESTSQRRAICFILDCSASMNEDLKAEFGLSGVRTTKLDAARTALLEMLRRLQGDDTEIGLVLYGHRMATGTSGDGLLVQKRYHKRFPFAATLQPYEDVEIAMRTGRFGIAELSQAREHLDATVPWGQTPLHLAISSATEDLHRLPSSVAKEVIVISDGQDYQFNPTTDAVVSSDEVVSKAQRLGVRVHLIGFGIRGQEVEAAEAAFQEIATGTGGKANVNVARASQLLQEIDALMSKTEFVVQSPKQKHLAKLGASISLDEITAANTLLQIAFNGKTETVPISAGSHLRLQISADGQRLTSTGYRVGHPSFVPLVTSDGVETDYRLAIHSPRQESGDLRFQVSLQSKDGSVAPRPASMWIEIHAEDSQSSQGDNVYRVGCSHWVADMPCPVRELVCKNWPEQADRIRVNAWCNETQSDAAKVVLEIGNEGYQPLPQFAGVTYRVLRQGEFFQVWLKDPRSDAANLMIQPIGSSASSMTYAIDDSEDIYVCRIRRPTAQPLSLKPSHQVNKALSVWIHSVAELKASAIRTEDSIERPLLTPVAQLKANFRR